LGTALGDADANVREAAIDSLVRLEPKPPSAARALLKFLRDRKTAGRSTERVRVLLTLRNYAQAPGVVTGLAEVLSDRDEEIGIRLLAGNVLRVNVPVRTVPGITFTSSEVATSSVVEQTRVGVVEQTLSAPLP